MPRRPRLRGLNVDNAVPGSAPAGFGGGVRVPTPNPAGIAFVREACPYAGGGITLRVP